MNRVKYSLFVEVLVSHGYYKKGVFRDLIVLPDIKTKACLEKADFIFKTSDRGFDLHFNEALGVQALKAQSKVLDQPLVFDLYCKNTWYTNFTEMPLDKLTFFEFSNKHVFSTDKELLIPELKEDITSSGKIARLVLDLAKFEQKAGCIPQTYKIVFNARLCQWNYYIVDAIHTTEQTLVVRGPEGESFDGPELVSTVKGEYAWHYSPGDKTYPMLESPEVYCTLSKYNELNGAYTLVEHLPAAFPGSITGFLNSDIGQPAVAESSIYIYL